MVSFIQHSDLTVLYIAQCYVSIQTYYSVTSCVPDVVLFVSMTYLFYSWKFLPFEPLHPFYSHPLSLATTNLFSISMSQVLIFLDSTWRNHIVFICLWFISLNIMPSKSNHVVTNGKNAFFLWLNHILLCVFYTHTDTYTHNFFFSHSSIGGHLDSFLVLAIVSNIAVNMWVHVSVLSYSGKHRSGIAGSYFNFLFFILMF